jgi:hypothetical protein
MIVTDNSKVIEGLEARINALNDAINYAISDGDAGLFLELWRGECWPELKVHFPDFKQAEDKS